MYVRLFVGKVVFHTYNDAKVVARNKDKDNRLFFARIWPKVKHEKIHVTKRTFQSFNRTIHCGICRRITVVETLQYMNTLDPVVVDFLISLIIKRLMTAPGDSHPLKRVFSTLHLLS